MSEAVFKLLSTVLPSLTRFDFRRGGKGLRLKEYDNNVARTYVTRLPPTLMGRTELAGTRSGRHTHRNNLDFRLSGCLDSINEETPFLPLSASLNLI